MRQTGSATSPEAGARPKSFAADAPFRHRQPLDNSMSNSPSQTVLTHAEPIYGSAAQVGAGVVGTSERPLPVPETSVDGTFVVVADWIGSSATGGRLDSIVSLLPGAVAQRRGGSSSGGPRPMHTIRRAS